MMSDRSKLGAVDVQIGSEPRGEEMWMGMGAAWQSEGKKSAAAAEVRLDRFSLKREVTERGNLGKRLEGKRGEEQTWGLEEKSVERRCVSMSLQSSERVHL